MDSKFLKVTHAKGSWMWNKMWKVSGWNCENLLLQRLLWYEFEWKVKIMNVCRKFGWLENLERALMTFGGEEWDSLVHAPSLGPHVPLTAGTDLRQGHQGQWQAVRVRHAEGCGTDQRRGGWKTRWRRNVASNCHIETNEGSLHSSFILDALHATQYVVIPRWSVLVDPERYSCCIKEKETREWVICFRWHNIGKGKEWKEYVHGFSFVYFLVFISRK